MRVGDLKRMLDLLDDDLEVRVTQPGTTLNRRVDRVALGHPPIQWGHDPIIQVNLET